MTATVNTPTTASADPQGMRVIWLLLIAAFVAILNETTMGIALPKLDEDLGITADKGQWLTSAFMLVMAVVIPTTGFLLQRFTTRAMFLTAMALFTAGTLICAVAPGFEVLLLGRVVQAGGTAIIMPLLMTTMMNVVPAPQRGRMMGRVSMVISLAPAIGPTMSGAILQTLGWRWTFGVVLPIAIVALVIGAKLLTNLGETTHAPIDVLSIILSAFAFGGIVYGLSQFGAPSTDQTVSPVTIGWITLSVGLVSLAIFCLRQLSLQKKEDALLDLRVFRSRNFTLSVAVMSILSLSMFGTFTLLPQFLQNVIGTDELTSGLVMLPGSIAMGLLGPVFGRIYDARGPRVLLVPGSILVSAVLWTYTVTDEHTSVWFIVALQLAMSVGMAMSFTPLFSASLGSLQPKYYSHGSAVLSTLQQVGGAAGVAVLVATYSGILLSQTDAGVSANAAGAAGAHTAFLIGACISLVAIVGTFFITKPADQESAPVGMGH